MSITPLNPSLPVVITTKENATAQCVGWIDYSAEQDLLWICAMDEDGAIWIVPNKEVRLQHNWSIGRRPKRKLPDSLIPQPINYQRVQEKSQ